MSYHVPVVATRTGAIEEIVVHGETGFLVERRSPGELACRIGQLFYDIELRRRMGGMGYERVNVNFNLRKIARQMLDICGVPDTTRSRTEVHGIAPSRAAGV